MARFSIETCSGCTRRCATCLRQTYPDRDAIKDWIGNNVKMPFSTIQRVLTELWQMGYRTSVGLNNYNEPLLDDRIPEIARFAKQLGFEHVRIITNGDLLTPELAKELDGAVAHITVSGYGDREQFADMKGWFKTTRLTLASGRHRLSHCSPAPTLKRTIKKLSTQPCFRRGRNFVVNHQGDCLLCCEEIVPHFDLGNVHLQPLAEIWNGKRRRKVMRDIGRPGGRLKYPYCTTCPCGSDSTRRWAVKDHD